MFTKRIAIILLLSLGTSYGLIGLGGRLGVFVPDGEYSDSYQSGLTGGGYIDISLPIGLSFEWAIDYFSKEKTDAPDEVLSVLPVTFSTKFNFYISEIVAPYMGVGLGEFFISDGSRSESNFGFIAGGGLKFFPLRSVNLVFDVKRNFFNFNDKDFGGWSTTLGLTFELLAKRPAPPPRRIETRPPKPYPRAVWIPGHWKWKGPRRGYVWIPGHWKRVR